MTGGCDDNRLRLVELGSSVLDPYSGRKNPRTDLKVGHYKSKQDARNGLRFEGVNCTGGGRKRSGDQKVTEEARWMASL